MFAGIASFTPKTSGHYAVEVTQDGNRYPGSPFKIDVSMTDVSSAAKVKATGAVDKAAAQEWNAVKLDISHAGELSFSV